jgi:hypothetical protein
VDYAEAFFVAEQDEFVAFAQVMNTL